MRTKFLLFTLLSLMAAGKGHAQDSSLLKMVGDSLAANTKPGPVKGTFKAIYLLQVQTNEGVAAGALNFEIQHRFGTINSGAYNFWGLDFATLRLGLDYGIADWWTIGIGRSSYLKTFDGFTKFKLFTQTTKGGGIPISVSLLVDISNYTQDEPSKPFLTSTYRTAYTTQLIMARKFRYFSLLLVPSVVHENLVPTVDDKNNMFALSGGARVKITKRTSIDAEYNYLFPNQVVSTKVYNCFSLGYEIETGGHVFQLIITNAQSMVPDQFLTQTTDSWSNGGIFFGFNLSRNFNITSHAKKTMKY
jgi:opacity protein-like surface antigen